MAELPVLDLCHIVVAKHQLRHADLLVDSSDHDLFIDRLVGAADKVAVEVHIQVVHRMYMRERLVDEDIVHVECVLRELQFTVSQKFRSVNDRMHQDILSCNEHLHIAPGKDLVLRKRQIIVHNFLVLRALFLIDKVCDQHIQGIFSVNKAAQGVKHLPVGLLIYPVIAVHNLKIDSGRGL